MDKSFEDIRILKIDVEETLRHNNKLTYIKLSDEPTFDWKFLFDKEREGLGFYRILIDKNYLIINRYFSAINNDDIGKLKNFIILTNKKYKQLLDEVKAKKQIEKDELEKMRLEIQNKNKNLNFD